MKKVAILLADGFEEVEAVTPADFLFRAVIDDLPESLDGLILPGGMPGSKNLAESDNVLSLIKSYFSRGKLIAAICAAPAVVLEKAGILDSKMVTCFPGYEDDFSNSVFKYDRVVVDNNIITSRAPGTAAEFALKIIEILTGKEAAENIFKKTLQKE